MPTISVLTMQGKEAGQMDLNEDIFGITPNTAAMHLVVRSILAARRQGTQSALTRGMVRGGGRKIYRQKGTGRARQGSTRSAQWKGGGKIHTPHMRSYVQSMPKKMRQAALRSALSVKAAESMIVVVDELKVNEPKTRIMAGALNTLVGDASALVLIPSTEEYEGVIRSTNNIPDAKVLNANYINIRDLMVFDKLVLPVAALDLIKANLG